MSHFKKGLILICGEITEKPPFDHIQTTGNRHLRRDDKNFGSLSFSVAL